jgi:FKBP-type peptidyl-prolyl cis-trans isomerase FkpA/FKBP-type peptidyl-prolyl cis-trans isomerase FklB
VTSVRSGWIVVALFLAGTAAARAGDVDLKTDEDKTLYILGVLMSQNLSPLKLSPAELERVKAGLADGALGKPPRADLQTYGPKVNPFVQTRMAAGAATEKKASETFLAKAAGEKGAKKTPSGLVYTETKAGSGESPKTSDTVKVHSTGKLTDGTVFDSSVQRGQPATFPLNGVIKCWTEGLQLMKVGGTATLVCPSDIAYGDQGRPPQIKPGATLVFDVELIEIVKK